MQFGGMLKNSFIDYPGKICSVVFTVGCNFRCPYCHNPNLVHGNGDVSLLGEGVLAFLKKRRGLIDGLAITGGEPTLHGALLPFLEKMKVEGFPVKLDTNGSRPEVLADILDRGLVDYVAMDLKTLPEAYPQGLGAPSDIASRLKRSIALIKNSGVRHEFRTTCVRPFVSVELMPELGTLIAGADRWCLQSCRLDDVLNPDYFTDPDAAQFTPEEMDMLKAAATPYVADCRVR